MASNTQPIVEQFDTLPDSAKVDMTVIRTLVGGKGRSTVYRWIDKGILPKPRKISGRNYLTAGELRAALAEM